MSTLSARARQTRSCQAEGKVTGTLQTWYLIDMISAALLRLRKCIESPKVKAETAYCVTGKSKLLKKGEVSIS